MDVPNKGGIIMNLSEKLIVLRKKNGWSQEDFADKLEVSRQAASRWENGTALPDAQNILRISKLFHVSADYLLNDECEEVPAVTAEEETVKPRTRNKNKMWWLLLPAACLVLVIACFALKSANYAGGLTNASHTHHGTTKVIENRVAGTCTEQGHYDEVIYCAECGEMISRTRVSEGVPTHHFENQKCTVCGKDQREKD